MDLWVNKVKEKVKSKIVSSNKSKQIYNTSSLLQDVRKYLMDLQAKFCISPIDKASKNFFYL